MVNDFQTFAIRTMVLKAHSALPSFKVCTLYTSLRLEYHCGCLKDQCALLKYHCQSVLLRGPCATYKNQHFSDIYQCALSKVQCALLKKKYQCAPLKYWCAVLKISNAHFSNIKLHTSEISTTPFSHLCRISRDTAIISNLKISFVGNAFTGNSVGFWY